jgi:hypothetical protein
MESFTLGVAFRNMEVFVCIKVLAETWEAAKAATEKMVADGQISLDSEAIRARIPQNVHLRMITFYPDERPTVWTHLTEAEHAVAGEQPSVTNDFAVYSDNAGASPTQ